MNAIHCLIIVSMFAMIQHGASDPKCKPHKMKPTEKVNMEYFYVTAIGSDILSGALCRIHPKFGKFINLMYRMGSQAKMVKGELVCGEYSCDEDRVKACGYQLLTADVYNSVPTCNIMPNVDPAALQDCIKHHRADQILIDNGKKRESYGIPAKLYSTLAFNGTYYKCADLSSAEALANFICLIYDNKIEPCK